MFLIYKLETFKNCKEVKHIMIMITDYDILSYVIFDQQLKITFRKSSAPPTPPPPPEKIHSPFLLTPPISKNSKSASPPFFANIENFSGPCAERGGGGHWKCKYPC